ncbi:MAG TPA: glycosyltransferase family 2 protein [Longilinea sp.]|nr:glycosyltransferase family 2 protein [Longilinea sp.]
MPTVSIIIPCLNEEKTIGPLLAAIAAQTFPIQQIEVIIADGMSTDGTRAAINTFSDSHPQLKIVVVENPKKAIPSGLNIALRVAKNDIFVRLDAHCVPQADYVERCVSDLESGLGQNVGGVWEIKPGGPGWQARSIAAAASNPLGVGDARYRYATSAGIVDTVPFGSFYRSLIDQIGFFDEELLTNEDYELNVRIRQNGGRIWLDPGIRTQYFSRPTFWSLMQQYWRYGYWKLRMLQKYPDTVRWRQIIPPFFVGGILGLIILSFFWRIARWMLLFGLLAYFCILSLGGLSTAQRDKDFALVFGMPIAMFIMHVCWGSGFIWSYFTSLFEANKSV